MAPYDHVSLDARAILQERYFPLPNSLDVMPSDLRRGLIPIALFAMMSLISVSILFGFITWRLISWRKHYKEYVGYNQYVILIYNLLLADLQQSIAFTITFHWLRLDAILAPTAACFVQGWFLHIGDVSSGFFVLAIAIHTWCGVVRGYRMPYAWFVCSICGIWLLALLLTVLGPIQHGNHFFTRAGGWCWVSSDYEHERLWLHYFWIFIVEFGTMAIYGHIFIHLRGRLRSIINNDTSKLSRANKFMILYPLAYVILTLPLAVGRMVSMTGVNMPDVFFCIAGSFLTSCGWVDALLYTLTRRVLVSNNLSSGDVSYHPYNRTQITTLQANGTRPGDDNFGLQSVKKETGQTGRTVTITGGSKRISRLMHGQAQRTKSSSNPMKPLREHHPSDSEESIVKPGSNGIGIFAETNIQVESAPESDTEISPRSSSKSRKRSESGFSAQSRP